MVSDRDWACVKLHFCHFQYLKLTWKMRKIDKIVWKCEAHRSSSNNRELMSVNFTSFCWRQRTDERVSWAYSSCWDIGERSDLGLCPWDWSTRYCTNRRERPSLLDLLSEFGLISDGWLGSISPLEIGPMHLSVEGLRPWDWSYPVLQYLREWPTPTVVSSSSRVLS